MKPEGIFHLDLMVKLSLHHSGFQNVVIDFWELCIISLPSDFHPKLIQNGLGSSVSSYLPISYSTYAGLTNKVV